MSIGICWIYTKPLLWMVEFTSDRSSQQRCSVKKGVLWKKAFLKISQNSQENTWARVYFLIKLQVARVEACNFIKKETPAQVFSCDFVKVSMKTFFTEHLWMTASNLTKFIFPFNLFQAVRVYLDLGFYQKPHLFNEKKVRFSTKGKYVHV